jgi:diacylglycerol kinase (ATP)
VTRRPILLLVNPIAGGRPGSGPGLDDDPERLRPAALAAALRDRGLEVDLHELAEDDDAAELARAAAEDHDIVVGGGDGTVSQVAAALLGHPDATLGILALGSFNNIARGSGVPDTLDGALDVIAEGRSGAIDCGWVVRDDGGIPFFEAAGVGLDAIGFLAVQIAENRGWWPALRALGRGLRRRRTPMRVTIDGRAYRTGSPSVTVSNGPYHGLGFAISADADPTDGLLDVAVFRGMSRFEVLRHFLAVARRRPRHEPRISGYRAARVMIEGTRRPLLAHADGVSIGTTPVTFEVRPAALRVFRPGHAGIMRGG